MKQTLKQQLHQFIERIDAMSQRERGLLFAAVLAVTVFASGHWLFAPQHRSQQQLKARFDSKLEQARFFEKEIVKLLERAQRSPDEENHARLVALRKQLEQMDSVLAQFTAGMVSPRQAVGLMQDMLRGRPGLKLVSAQNQSPVPLANDEAGDAGNNVAAASAGSLVYKHGVQLVIEGRYPALVAYLQELEKLKWKVFWGEVSLEAEHYPLSRLTLVIYTLSLNEAWMGV